MFNMAIVKPVSFKNKEQDLVDFVGNRDFSYYVKELIRRDMKKENYDTNNSEDIKPKKKRNINFEF